MSTNFAGTFKLDQPLTVAHLRGLEKFSQTEHCDENLPGRRCDWVPTEDGDGITWNGTDGTFNDPPRWLRAIIEYFLQPWGYVLNGEVVWSGPEAIDHGMIRVINNRVIDIPCTIYPNPFAGCKRYYSVHSETWYTKPLHDGCVEDITFGFRDDIAHELRMFWEHAFSGAIAPRMEVCADGWATFASLPEVLIELAKINNQDFTPKQFCKILDRCGFVDVTQRTKP